MMRTYNAFPMLRAVAAVLCLAVLLWSLGGAFIRFAEAASVTSLSDTLSDSAPSVASNHTISFVTPTGVANGETITINFSDGPFVVGTVNHTDIDVATTSDFTVAADCTGTDQVSAAFSGTTLTITFCTGDGATIAANGTTTIEIGTNATSGVAGDAQLTNPAVGSYQIPVTAGASDSGETRVAIIDTVTVSANVDTTFNFTVTGIATAVAVNGHNTTGSTTATAIPFGELQAGTASTAGQNLAVTTNAANGFSVTVQVDQQLTSATGADIDGFIDGAYTSTPTAWTSPTPVLGNDDTYGHWGITTEDGFASQSYVSASTTPVEVFSHTGPSDGSTAGIGTTQVGYRVEVSSLQEAGGDYEATLTYVATPVF